MRTKQMKPLFCQNSLKQVATLQNVALLTGTDFLPLSPHKQLNRLTL